MALVALDPLPQFDGPQGVTVAGDFSATSENFEDPHVLKLHKPHAFALMHGDGGAKVAYGEFVWRLNLFNFSFGNSVSEGGECNGVGLSGGKGGAEIQGFNSSVVPTIGDKDGPAMDPDIPNVYHQLDDYGEVYLYWKIETVLTEFVTECFIEVVPDGGTGTATSNIAAVSTSNDDHKPVTDGVPTGGAGQTAVYRLKLGKVVEGELIEQNISSDVFWAYTLVERDKAD